MMAKVSSDILVSGMTSEQRKAIRGHLTLDNPDYLQAVKLKLRGISKISKKLHLYWEDGDSIHIPYGCQDFLIGHWPTCEIESSTVKHQSNQFGNVQLSEAQALAVGRCSRRVMNPFIQSGGILVGPCGCGKTRMGIAVASNAGVPTLWLTHKIGLAEQAMRSATELIGPEGLALTKDGKLNLGDRITFATVQTMSKVDLSQIRDRFGLIIVDECHHCVGSVSRMTMFSSVLNSLTGPRIGLTATPERSDGLERAMFALIGPIITQIPREDIKNRFCKIVYRQFDAEPSIDLTQCLSKSGTIDNNKLIQQLIDDEGRLALLLDMIATAPRPCLVLSSRLSLLNKIKEEIQDATMLKKERESSASLCLATYQLVSEGYDRPDLASVIFATPENNDTRIIQSAGRVQRANPGKEVGYVLDIRDICDYIKWEKSAGHRRNLINSLNQL